MSIKDAFKKRQNEIPFLIFIAFLISFTIARMYVLLDLGGPAPGTKTYQLHHLYYGIALLIIAGWIAINYRDKSLLRITALIYGSGIGIFFDEIGLILTHFRNYYDGITYTVVIIVSLIFLNIVFFKEFWESVRTELQTFAEKKKLKYGPLNLMGLINIVDRADEKMVSTSKLGSIFTGIVLIASGFLILEYPEFIKYWIAGAFFLSGLGQLIRTIK